MPSPHKGEKRKDFIDRCMGDGEANDTFPDESQRLGFCYSQWHEHHNCLHTHARRIRFDPTRTLTLRARYERDMVRRFKKLKRAIREVFDEDGLGLKTNAPRFDFTRSGDKVDAFMQWLQQQERQGVLEVMRGTPLLSSGSRSWQDVYIASAYQKGLAQAANNMKGQGVDVQDSYIDSAFFRPMHADRAGLIFTRSFSDLRGITNAMDTRISRTLSQGIIDGLGVQEIARNILDDVDSVGIVRARMLARTEVINAHAEASLNTYTEAGLEGVKVQAEFTTAGDNAVCPQCAELENADKFGLGAGVYPIEASHGIIPVHPNCRCAWLPVVDNPQGLSLK